MTEDLKPTKPIGLIHPDEEQGEKEDHSNDIPEGVTRHDNRTTTVELIYPVELGDDVFDKVTVHSPKGKELMRLDKAKGDFERSVMMISVVGKFPMPAARELEVCDIERINDEIDFLKGTWQSRKT